MGCTAYFIALFVVIGCWAEGTAIPSGDKDIIRNSIQQAAIERKAAVRQRAINGATSTKYSRKRSNNMSRSMEDSNFIVRRASQLLTESNEFRHLRQTEAARIVRGEMEMTGYAPGIPDIQTFKCDICNGVTPSCNANEKFSRIDGQCNNLDNPFWGSECVALTRTLHGVHDLHINPTHTSIFRQQPSEGCEKKNADLPKIIGALTQEVPGWDIDLSYGQHTYGQSNNLETHYYGKECGRGQKWFGWNWSHQKVGTISARLEGSGMGVLEFGNCYWTTGGQVAAFIDGVLIGVGERKTGRVSNGGFTQNVTAEFFYREGSVLSLRTAVGEIRVDAIIQINSLKFIDQDSCVDYGYEYLSFDEHEFENVTSLTACAQLCANLPADECIYWTWRAAYSEFRPRACLLKRSGAIRNRMKNIKAASGHRSCLGTPVPSNFDDGMDSHECPDECHGKCIGNVPRSLPNARLVSSNFHQDLSVRDSVATHLVTQFGQFLSHDLSFTPETDEHGCCETGMPMDGEEVPEECLPIKIPEDDGFFATRSRGPVTCLEFSRSVEFCTEPTPESGGRDQFNAITAFVDASNVYGSDEEENRKLRTAPAGHGCHLKTSLGGGDGDMSSNIVDENAPTNLGFSTAPRLLPFLRNEDSNVTEETAGDMRAREMPGLAAMHTLFLREHNQICDLLMAKYPSQNGEQLFLNARRIVIAEMQNTVYGQYLPVVLGEQAMDDFGLSLSTQSSYNATLEPSISNSFATAAFRFHSMIQGVIQMFRLNGDYARSYPLRDNFFNLDNYHVDDGVGMDQIIAGLARQAAQTQDRFITSEVTEFLFRESGHDHGSDLIARNIQRGRDHGLPSFAAFYNRYGPQDDPNRSMDCWAMKPVTIGADAWAQLQNLYHHPHQIDLFVGGLAEWPVVGGLSGSVFTGIQAEQFKALKDGDRFFFMHESIDGATGAGFSLEAQNRIKERSFADIICDNTRLERLPVDVFTVSGDRNEKMCGQVTPATPSPSQSLQNIIDSVNFIQA